MCSALWVLISWSLLLMRQGYADSSPCRTTEECCDLCGDGSMRCIRGPCSTNYVLHRVFSVSVPLVQARWADTLASFYGIMPSALVLCFILLFCCGRRTWMRLLLVLYLPTSTLLTRVTFREGLGDCACCFRPCGSCVPTHGMPSGHTSNAVGLATWLHLELFLGSWRHMAWHWKVPLMFISWILLLPVPFSRVYLGDHTILQVTVGAMGGLSFALLYYGCIHCVLGPMVPSLSRWVASKRWACTVNNDIDPSHGQWRHAWVRSGPSRPLLAPCKVQEGEQDNPTIA